MEENKINYNEIMQNMIEEYKKAHTPKIRKYPKVRRNEICPFCNSGLKFKNCCYNNPEYNELV